MDVEANLFELERQHQEEERVLAEKYFKQKSSYYKQRNDLVKEIPNFWLTALENHTVLGNLLEVNDLEILKYLTDIVVERPMSGHVKIMFEFSPNPFFQENVLMKEYITETEEQVKVVNYPITWTQNEEFTRSTCFIQFFANQELDLGEIIVDDLYPNAFKFFQGVSISNQFYFICMFVCWYECFL